MLYHSAALSISFRYFYRGFGAQSLWTGQVYCNPNYRRISIIAKCKGNVTIHDVELPIIALLAQAALSVNHTRSQFLDILLLNTFPFRLYRYG